MHVDNPIVEPLGPSNTSTRSPTWARKSCSKTLLRLRLVRCPNRTPLPGCPGPAVYWAWPSQPQAFVESWNAWRAGNERQAVDIHEREIAPLARLSAAGLRLGHTIHKELLRRQGVISRATVRAPSDALDDITTHDLDVI